MSADKLKRSVATTLDLEIQKLTDSELRARITEIRGKSNRAGSQARRLDMAEVLLLSRLLAEESLRETRLERDDSAAT